MSNYTNVNNKGYINIRFRLKNNSYGKECTELMFVMYRRTNRQTHKEDRGKPWGNGSESLIVHVFEYECFSVTVLIKPVIIMNC